MKQLFLIVKKEDGMALAMVIIAMVVVFIVVASVINFMSEENMHSLYQTDEMEAYYVARAGAESMAMELINTDNVKEFQQYTVAQKALATDILGSDGDVEVSVEIQGGFYMVKSIGAYNGHISEVEIALEYVDDSDMEFAAWSEEDMGAQGASNAINTKKIVGGLGSGNSIYTHTGKSNGIDAMQENIANVKHFKYPDISDLDLSNPSRFKEFDFSHEKSEFDAGNPSDYWDGSDIIIEQSTIIVGQDVTNKDILIDTSNGKFVKGNTNDWDEHFDMDIASGDQWLVIYIEDEFVFKGDMYIEGTDNLMIIVEDAFSIDGKIEFIDDVNIEIYVMDNNDDTSEGDNVFKNTSGNDYDFVVQGGNSDHLGVAGKEDNLNIFLFDQGDDNNDVDMSVDTNADIYGFINGPEATIHLKNGSTVIYGGIYANEIQFDAGVSIELPGDPDTIYSHGFSMQINHWE